jgi:hypothetical protein
MRFGSVREDVSDESLPGFYMKRISSKLEAELDVQIGSRKFALNRSHTFFPRVY